jgi:hypothetical protein
MMDMDNDGDRDWVGTSMTLGKAFIMEQVHPPESLVTTITLPDDFTGTISKLLITLAPELPVTGPPAAVLAQIDNGDIDGDGIGDVDNILSPSKNLVLAIPDVGLAGSYHVVVALYMEGGGVFQPVAGVDYVAASPKVEFGQGQITVDLVLELVPALGSASALALQVDSDGDGLTDLAERIAGTDPQIPSEPLQATISHGVGDDSVILLKWDSEPDTEYGIYASTNLAGDWELIDSVVGSGSPMTYRAALSSCERCFYQVRAVSDAPASQ